MNVIALMPHLSIIKRLKMYVQATFVFFCAKLYKLFCIYNIIIYNYNIILSYCIYIFFKF